MPNLVRVLEVSVKCKPHFPVQAGVLGFQKFSVLPHVAYRSWEDSILGVVAKKQAGESLVLRGREGEFYNPPVPLLCLPIHTKY